MRRVLLLLMCVAMLATSAAAVGGSAGAAPRPSAESILREMTPEERVGQLFLVTFQGVPEAGDRVFDLITRHYVSGVILRASNDNFVDARLGRCRPRRDLIARLQSPAMPTSGAAATPAPGEREAGPLYVPLLVGLSMDRDGRSVPEVLSGLSELPTEMAIGGTWSPALARRVGEASTARS